MDTSKPPMKPPKMTVNIRPYQQPINIPPRSATARISSTSGEDFETFHRRMMAPMTDEDFATRTYLNQFAAPGIAGLAVRPPESSATRFCPRSHKKLPTPVDVATPSSRFLVSPSNSFDDDHLDMSGRHKKDPFNEMDRTGMYRSSSCEVYSTGSKSSGLQFQKRSSNRPRLSSQSSDRQSECSYSMQLPKAKAEQKKYAIAKTPKRSFLNCCPKPVIVPISSDEVDDLSNLQRSIVICDRYVTRKQPKYAKDFIDYQLRVPRIVQLPAGTTSARTTAPHENFVGNDSAMFNQIPDSDVTPKRHMARSSKSSVNTMNQSEDEFSTTPEANKAGCSNGKNKKSYLHKAPFALETGIGVVATAKGMTKILRDLLMAMTSKPEMCMDACLAGKLTVDSIVRAMQQLRVAPNGREPATKTVKEWLYPVQKLTNRGWTNFLLFLLQTELTAFERRELADHFQTIPTIFGDDDKPKNASGGPFQFWRGHQDGVDFAFEGEDGKTYRTNSTNLASALNQKIQTLPLDVRAEITAANLAVSQPQRKAAEKLLRSLGVEPSVAEERSGIIAKGIATLQSKRTVCSKIKGAWRKMKSACGSKSRPKTIDPGKEQLISRFIEATTAMATATDICETTVETKSNGKTKFCIKFEKVRVEACRSVDDTSATPEAAHDLEEFYIIQVGHLVASMADAGVAPAKIRQLLIAKLDQLFSDSEDAASTEATTSKFDESDVLGNSLYD